MTRLAAALRLTEGQLYTVVTGAIVAMLLLALGMPSLRTVEEPAAAASPTSPSTSDELVPDPVPLGPALADAVVPTPTTAPELSLAVPSAPLPANPSGRRAPTTTSPPSAVSDPPTGGELALAFARYASASGPLVPGGNPGSFLPVGLKVGNVDKQSYVRVRGEGDLLRLAVSTTPGHTVGGTAGVRACAIVLPGWDIADGSSLGTAPPYDTNRCVDGKPGQTEWTFAVGGIESPDGFALVPVGTAPDTFQIVFEGIGG